VTDEERENAYGLALSITMADAELDAEEREFLLHLRRALGIADERAAAMRDAVCFDEARSQSGGCDDDDISDEP
jgi:tellurite resistance protein